MREIVLWRVGATPVTIKTIDECSNDGAGLDEVIDLALAGQRVAFQETNGGNNLEMIVSTATLARPRPQMDSYVENGDGAAGDPAGRYDGDLVGHDSLLAYATWTRCDTPRRRLRARLQAGPSRPVRRGRCTASAAACCSGGERPYCIRSGRTATRS